MVTMTDNIGNEAATEATSESNTQADTVKTYTQEEVDAMMARTRSSVEHKVSKKYSVYEELGDVEELRNLKADAERTRQKKQIEKGEFEKTLKELAEKKDSEIQRLYSEIKEYKVNTPLLNAAAKYKSVNPEQVRDLLIRNVRLSESGDPEVVGSDGTVKYDDSGMPYSVENLVREFLDSNPHFVQPTPSTTNTQTSHGKRVGELDISKLDMSNPEHRALYAKYRKDHGIA
jgi:hypothetical protein